MNKIEGIEETDLHRMYNEEDMSMQMIANYYGVSLGVIWSRFREYGIQSKTLSEAHRQYAINEDFFKIWGKEQAWLYGWAIGDGNFTDPTIFRFNLQRGDREVLEKIKVILKSEHPIYNGICYDKRYKKSYHKSYIGFTSMKLVADLKKLKYSDIPNEYLPDFIRGFFEAEGTWIRDKNRVQFGLRFAQKDRTILDWIWATLKGNNIVDNGGMAKDRTSGSWTLKFGLHDAIKLYHFMYNNCGNLYLKRKKERFKELMEKWEKSKIIYKQRRKEKSWVRKYSKRLEEGTITVDEIWKEESKIRKVLIKRSSVLRRINAMGYKTAN